MRVYITDKEMGDFIPLECLYFHDQETTIFILESKKVNINGWERSFMWFKPNVKGELPYQLAVFAVMFEDGTCWDVKVGVRPEKVIYKIGDRITTETPSPREQVYQHKPIDDVRT
jgi:hypothetical protein